MVKMLVLDVDGVIVGNKDGVNFPYPNEKVISALKLIREKGIPVVLCSSKYRSSVEPITLMANLDNPHITDSGALIVNPVRKETISAFEIEKELVTCITDILVSNGFYIEAYSEMNNFIQKGTPDEIIRRRVSILQKEPVIVDSLADEVKKHKIIKLLSAAQNEEDKEKINSLLKSYIEKAKIIWSMHPATKPWQYCLITAPNVSKNSSFKEVANILQIPPEEVLGVGDTLGDWEFMKECGYVATMGEAPEELKNLVKSKNGIVSASVNDNGILQILDHFQLS